MKRFIRIIFSFSLLVSGLSIAIAINSESSVHAANPNKITICHRTSAVNNPYRRITVNFNSIATSTAKGGANSGHGQWTHNLWPTHVADNDDVNLRPDPNVFNPAWKESVYKTATQKEWGDIIPFTLDDGSSYNRGAKGLNFSGAGEAIYNGTTFNGVNYAGLCKRLNAGQYCQSLINEGGTLAQCQTELVEMEALDDEATKDACGGSFANCSLSTLSSIRATTGTVTCASNVPTLNGSVATGTVAHTVTFEYGTDVSLTTSTSVTATPSSVTGTANVSATLSALNDGTYYYRTVATEPTDEGRLEGGVASFSVTASGCTVLTTGEDPNLETPAETPAETPVGGYKGALKGVVWIDQNRNGKQDSNEPGLPFTPLVAELVQSSVSSQSIGGSSSGGVRAASVRRMAINATTDAKGFYDVPSLEPGSWTVTAKLQVNSLERTFDTGGLASDWFASAIVPINGVGEADFAAAGNARVALTVEPTATCTRAKSVEVTWAGVDNKLGTKDDVTFVGTVTQKEALIRGLPWGSYTVIPICADGTRLAKQTLIITKAQSTKVTKLTVELAPAALPATGSQTNMSLLLLSLSLVGLGVVMASPRRRIHR